jgi:hypothetical protein
MECVDPESTRAPRERGLHDPDVELHRLGGGHAGDGIEGDKQVVIALCVGGGGVFRLQQVHTLHRTSFQMFLGNFLGAIETRWIRTHISTTPLHMQFLDSSPQSISTCLRVATYLLQTADILPSQISCWPVAPSQQQCPYLLARNMHHDDDDVINQNDVT